MQCLPWRWTRREMLKASACALGASIAALGYAWRIEPHWIDWVDEILPIPNLDPNLIGKTLVQISDLHVGPVCSDYLRRSLKQVATLEPDWLVITGDFMSCTDAEQIDEVARVLEDLPVAKRGTVAILGNHDYGKGWNREDVADKLIKRLRNAGVIVLQNQRRIIGGLDILGTDDLWHRSFDVRAITSLMHSSMPQLVLCHNPDGADLPIWSGFTGWMLSGHTHGGQCKSPFLPPPVLPVKNHRYVSGGYELSDGRGLYINRGLGYLCRLRFNARPEVTRFTLVDQPLAD